MGKYVKYCCLQSHQPAARVDLIDLEEEMIADAMKRSLDECEPRLE